MSAQLELSRENLKKLGVFRELARLFAEPQQAEALLAAAGLPPDGQPPPPADNETFWAEACVRIEVRGKPLSDLLAEAVTRAPDSEILNRAVSVLMDAGNFEASISVPSAPDIWTLVETARHVAQELGLPGSVDPPYALSGTTQLYLKGMDGVQAKKLAEGVSARLGIETKSNFTEFHDYLLQQIYVQVVVDGREISSGPRRDISVSTRILELVQEQLGRLFPGSNPTSLFGEIRVFHVREFSPDRRVNLPETFHHSQILDGARIRIECNGLAQSVRLHTTSEITEATLEEIHSRILIPLGVSQQDLVQGTDIAETRVIELSGTREAIEEAIRALKTGQETRQLPVEIQTIEEGRKAPVRVHLECSDQDAQAGFLSDLEERLNELGTLVDVSHRNKLPNQTTAAITGELGRAQIYVTMESRSLGLSRRREIGLIKSHCRSGDKKLIRLMLREWVQDFSVKDQVMVPANGIPVSKWEAPERAYEEVVRWVHHFALTLLQQNPSEFDETPKLTWLHLSDLHAFEPKTGGEARQVLGRLREDLKRMEQEHQLTPDLIFFTGDAVFGHTKTGLAIAEQFRAASDFLEGVRGAFSKPVPKENVFIVPGNHDVDRSFATPDQAVWMAGATLEEITTMVGAGELQWRRYAERLDGYRDFLNTNGYGHLLANPKHADWLMFAVCRMVGPNGIKVGIAGLNSSWSCGGDGGKGRLWMAGGWQLATLSPELDGAHVKIALMHHPPSWLTGSEGSDVAREIEREFNFLLHGHQSDGWVNESDGHVRIGAGPCYRRPNVENGYSIVRFDPATQEGEIWLRCYDRFGGGWTARLIYGKNEPDGCWRVRCEPRSET
jgi:predicted MPP superfamily phosphohydrolase